MKGARDPLNKTQPNVTATIQPTIFSQVWQQLLTLGQQKTGVIEQCRKFRVAENEPKICDRQIHKYQPLLRGDNNK